MLVLLLSNGEQASLMDNYKWNAFESHWVPHICILVLYSAKHGKYP